MSFYRIYRPQVIDEIDNVGVRESLLQLLSKSKKTLPHAYLFSGPRGAGKTTAARVVAKLFNCQKPTKSGPCGACQQCTSIAEGRNLDVLEIDAASNRGIDEMRALRDAIALAPVSAPFRIYIIDEVHMLTAEAFNALLKTLEEPPAHAVFILATTDPQKVPVTIKSRCTPLVFRRATADELAHALARIVKKEKIPIDEPALVLIAQSVDGSFRDAVKLLEQASFHTGHINEETVRGILSLATTESVALFIGALSSGDIKKALGSIDGVVSGGADMKTFITQCLQYLEKLLVLHATGEEVDEAWDGEKLQMAIGKLSWAYVEMKSTPIAQLPVEVAVVEFCEEHALSFPRMRESTLSESKGDPQVKPEDDKKKEVKVFSQENAVGSLTLEKLVEHWGDVISQLKPFNHSIAGVMRSTRPKAVAGGIVTIEAFYTFHKDKLSESKTKDMLSLVFKKLFGEKVKVEVVLGKK